MRLDVPLSHEKEICLQAMAAAAGKDVESYVQDWLLSHLPFVSLNFLKIFWILKIFWENAYAFFNPVYF